MLRIHSSAQLDVCLPFNPNDDSSIVIGSTKILSSSQHPMQTRLKSGTIQRQDYSDLAFCGYTALLSITWTFFQ